MNQNLKKAILFFSRTAEEEAKHKRFDAMLSQKGNIAIGQGLIDATLGSLSDCDVPLISCYSSDQVGSNFGDKLANAVEDVFANGYEQVIVVGNDCPFISSELISESFDLIDEGKMVLGPANDGGVYLLGFDKAKFNRQAFINLSWEKANLQDSFHQYVQEIGVSIEWLDEQIDIDTVSDFFKVLNDLPKYSALKIKLLKIIAGFQVLIIQLLEQIHISFLTSSKLSLRGPPTA